MLTEPSTGDQTLHLRNCHSLDCCARKDPLPPEEFASIKNRDQSGISPTCGGAKPDVWDQLKVRRENKEEDMQESIQAEQVLLEVGRRLSLEFCRGGVT